MTEAALTRYRSLLNPRSVAIIGAGKSPTTFNGAPIYNLRVRVQGRFPMPVISLSGTKIQGLTSYATVLDVPGDVDTAVIAVPAALRSRSLNNADRKVFLSATLVSSGFAEEAGGRKGRERASISTR